MKMILVAIVGLSLSACTTSRPATLGFRPVVFEANGYIATVHGGLNETTPPGDARTRLANFLYGPEVPITSAVTNPQGMTWHAERAFVCDQALPGILELDPQTGALHRWTSVRDGPVCPVHIAFDDRDRAYVPDTTLGRILVFDAQGKRLRELAMSASDALGSRCSAVLFHNGVLHVTDHASRRIARLDVAAESWLEPYPLSDDPTRLGIPTGLAVDTNGNLLIADALLGIVHRLTTDGRFLPTIGKRGRGHGELVRPMHVLATPDGLILVTDAARQSLMVFNDEGGFVMEIGGPKDSWPGFTLPCGIALIPLSAADAKSQLANHVSTLVVSDTLGAIPVTVITIRRVEAQEEIVE